MPIQKKQLPLQPNYIVCKCGGKNHPRDNRKNCFVCHQPLGGIGGDSQMSSASIPPQPDLTKFQSVPLPRAVM